MKLKDDAKSTYSDDYFYDLFEHGKLAPEKFLELPEEVREAMDIVEEYLDFLERNEMIVKI